MRKSADCGEFGSFRKGNGTFTQPKVSLLFVPLVLYADNRCGRGNEGSTRMYCRSKLKDAAGKKCQGLGGVLCKERDASFACLSRLSYSRTLPVVGLLHAPLPRHKNIFYNMAPRKEARVDVILQVPVQILL